MITRCSFAHWGGYKSPAGALTSSSPPLPLSLSAGGVDFDALATMARDTPRSHQFPSLPESVVIIYPRSDLLTPPEVPFSPFPSPSSSSSASPSSQSSLQLVEELRQHGCCAMVDEDSPRNSLDHLGRREGGILYVSMVMCYASMVMYYACQSYFMLFVASVCNLTPGVRVE